MADYIAAFITGAGLASIVLSLLAWREAFQWMATLDNCHRNLERLSAERDHWRTMATSAQEVLDGKCTPIEQVVGRFTEANEGVRKNEVDA